MQRARSLSNKLAWVCGQRNNSEIWGSTRDGCLQWWTHKPGKTGGRHVDKLAFVKHSSISLNTMLTTSTLYATQKNMGSFQQVICDCRMDHPYCGIHVVIIQDNATCCLNHRLGHIQTRCLSFVLQLAGGVVFYQVLYTQTALVVLGTFCIQPYQVYHFQCDPAWTDGKSSYFVRLF